MTSVVVCSWVKKMIMSSRAQIFRSAALLTFLLRILSISNQQDLSTSLKCLSPEPANTDSQIASESLRNLPADSTHPISYAPPSSIAQLHSLIYPKSGRISDICIHASFKLCWHGQTRNARLTAPPRILEFCDENRKSVRETSQLLYVFAFGVGGGELVEIKNDCDWSMHGYASRNEVGSEPSKNVVGPQPKPQNWLRNLRAQSPNSFSLVSKVALFSDSVDLELYVRSLINDQ